MAASNSGLTAALTDMSETVALLEVYSSPVEARPQGSRHQMTPMSSRSDAARQQGILGQCGRRARARGPFRQGPESWSRPSHAEAATKRPHSCWSARADSATK